LVSSSASGTAATAKNSPLLPLPTIEQLSSDPFIKQVSYAERVIVECLMMDTSSNDANAEESANCVEIEQNKKKLAMLKAQLSHSDGIRGFFVTYLTAMAAAVDSTTNNAVIQIPPADRRHVPPLLIEAMKSVTDADDLIRLACMNVIMPSGMMTMHKDAELSAQSKTTATRAVRVLESLHSIHPTAVQQHVSAIYAVAASSSSSSSSSSRSGKAAADSETAEDELIGFWTRFFEKWGYQEKQRNAIASAVQSIMNQ
jgi:hypothetical protein